MTKLKKAAILAAAQVHRQQAEGSARSCCCGVRHVAGGEGGLPARSAPKLLARPCLPALTCLAPPHPPPPLPTPSPCAAPHVRGDPWAARAVQVVRHQRRRTHHAGRAARRHAAAGAIHGERGVTGGCVWRGRGAACDVLGRAWAHKLAANEALWGGRPRSPSLAGRTLHAPLRPPPNPPPVQPTHAPHTPHTQILHDTDVDGNGTIDYEEFVAGESRCGCPHRKRFFCPQGGLRTRRRVPPALNGRSPPTLPLVRLSPPPPSPLLAATVNLNLLEREEIFVKAFQQMDKVGGWGGWVGGRACGSGATVADMQAGCASLPSPRPPANVSCTPSTVRGAQALPSPARPTTTQPARAQDGSGTLSADEVAEAVGATGRMRESEAKDLIARHAWGGGCWVCEWCGGGCRARGSASAPAARACTAWL